MGQILVLYYSLNGGTKKLAYKIAQGAQQNGCDVIIRTVPKVSNGFDELQPNVPEEGDPYVTLDELSQCSGLALGSPTRFGNMSGAMKYFLDSTVSQWVSGSLIGKPACVFTSTSSLHGGQETTLLSMMIPLLHHGMVVTGIPYSEPNLHTTRSGGTPYGATHVSYQQTTELSNEESELAIAQGKHLARIAKQLGQA